MKDFLYVTFYNSLIYSLRVVSGFSLFLIATLILVGLRGTSYLGELQKIKITQEQDTLEYNYIIQKDHIKDADLVPKVIYNQESRYSIRYPSSWEQIQNGLPASMTLNGQEGTLSFLSNVNIQTIRTQKSGGNYASISQFMTDLKKTMNQLSNVRYLENGPISLRLLNGTTVNGQYIIFTFSNQGLAFKQWQVIVPRQDGQVLYIWSFVSPLKQFPRDLSVAQAMLNSWNFY